MTKNEILDYIMSTPENTNRQVLQYMLDDIEGSGGEIPTIVPEQETENGYIVDFSELTADFFVLETTDGSFLGIFAEDQSGVTHVLLCSEDGGPAEVYAIDSTVDSTELTFENVFSPATIESDIQTCTIAIDENDVNDLSVSASSLTEPLPSFVNLAVDGTLGTEYHFLEGGGLFLDTEFDSQNYVLAKKNGVANLRMLYGKYFLDAIENETTIVLYLTDKIK